MTRTANALIILSMLGVAYAAAPRTQTDVATAETTWRAKKAAWAAVYNEPSHSLGNETRDARERLDDQIIDASKDLLDRVQNLEARLQAAGIP